MKEATGELTGSVIVVSVVALLTAFFFMFVWPNVKDNMNDRARCADALCDNGYNSNGMAYCKVPDDSDNPDDTPIFECPFRG